RDGQLLLAEQRAGPALQPAMSRGGPRVRGAGRPRGDRGAARDPRAPRVTPPRRPRPSLPRPPPGRTNFAFFVTSRSRRGNCPIVTVLPTFSLTRCCHHERLPWAGVSSFPPLAPPGAGPPAPPDDPALTAPAAGGSRSAHPPDRHLVGSVQHSLGAGHDAVVDGRHRDGAGRGPEHYLVP